ncbi:MAG: hypothetical protein LBB83_11645 [Treponema sp.]|jgi:hypothetical protein|nr:hypothetical protein [Treponema sp.]
MIKIDAKYTDYFDNTDPLYPYGKAVDTSNGDAEDGTPYKADWMNDVDGFHQAAIVEGQVQISGVPDRTGASDILNALKKIMSACIGIEVTAEKILALLLTVDGAGSGLDADLLGGHTPSYYLSAILSGYYIKPISGPETVIPWLELDIQYAGENNLIIFISAHGGPYKEFVSFPYATRDDGLEAIRLTKGANVGELARHFGMTMGSGEISKAETQRRNSALTTPLPEA